MEEEVIDFLIPPSGDPLKGTSRITPVHVAPLQFKHGGGLLGDVFGSVFADLAAEVDGIVVNDDAAHALLGFLAVDGHEEVASAE